MRICDIIRNLRESRHMTQIDMARRSGISQATISALEKGTRQPSMEMLEKLSDFFGVPKSVFMQETDSGADESIHAIVESLHQNPKRRMLFDKTMYFTESDLDVILTVVNAISKEREENGF